LIFGAIAGGTIWLNRVAAGVWRLWPLLAFLLLYNRIFLWGFVNYLFGIGVALGGTALWLALEQRGWWIRALVSSVAALACYFSHIAAFGFYALVIFGVEAAPAFTELRLGDWPALGRRAAIAGTQLVIPAALFLGSWQDTARGPSAMPDSCARPISCSVCSTITIAPLTSAVLLFSRARRLAGRDRAASHRPSAAGGRSWFRGPYCYCRARCTGARQVRSSLPAACLCCW
jgi:hypothetical protein